MGYVSWPAAVVREVHRPSLPVQDQLGPVPARVLVFDYHLLVSDLVELLRSHGALVQLCRPETLSIALMRQLLADFKPVLVFAINYEPHVAALCSALHVPYLSWTIDPLPNTRLKRAVGISSEHCLAFAHRRRTVERLRELGLVHAHWLPLAAPANRRQAIRDASRLLPYQCTVSFVGGSLASEQRTLLNELGRAGLNAEQVRRIERYLQGVFEERSRQPEFMGFDELGDELPQEFLAWLPVPRDAARLAELFNGRLSQLYRISRVRALDALGISVYGDEGWQGQVRNYRGLADHGDELTLIYNASLINLDIPRLYQRDIVTMRVFDILATSGFLLSENSHDLSELFHTGIHLVSCSAEQELGDVVEEWRAKPERAARIAAHGQREVLAHHQLSQRLNSMLSFARQLNWF